MTEEIEILKLVSERLELANIPYMLTGSLASNFYVVPRMTRDIDIVVEIQPTAIDEFFQIFQDDFYIDKFAISQALTHSGMFNIIHNNTVIKIDFIIRKNWSYRATEFQRKMRFVLGISKIWIVSPEDLILSKLLWAKDSLSELQINDVKNLLSNVKNLDISYLEKWVHELKLNDLFEKVKAYE